jgi:hypothetical protein
MQKGNSLIFETIKTLSPKSFHRHLRKQPLISKYNPSLIRMMLIGDRQAAI